MSFELSKEIIEYIENSAEEGLGNLKGSRKIMEDYQGRVKEFYTFDGSYKRVANKCVGSQRYKITLETEGGHSFSKFEYNNAIHIMSKLVCSLYSCNVPVVGNSKTTYNVGVINGGTSVNTIAQKCELMYEYRSDNKDCLSTMKKFFEFEIAKVKEEGNSKC